MSSLPRVTEKARELVAREFDARGPDVCVKEIVEHLKRYDPELLDMAAKWAADLENPTKAMLGFGMFYRLLMPKPPSPGILSLLPRVSEETRALLVKEIDEKGAGTSRSTPSQNLKRAIPSCFKRHTILPREWETTSGVCRDLHCYTGHSRCNRGPSAQSLTERGSWARLVPRSTPTNLGWSFCHVRFATFVLPRCFAKYGRASPRR